MTKKNGWRPIESAPLGVVVLTRHIDMQYPYPAYCQIRQNGDSFWWMPNEDSHVDMLPFKRIPLSRKPTHWLPLSALPDSPGGNLMDIGVHE